MYEEMFVLINRQNVERLYKGVVQNVFYHILESSWCAFDESVLPIGKSSCSWINVYPEEMDKALSETVRECFYVLSLWCSWF